MTDAAVLELELERNAVLETNQCPRCRLIPSCVVSTGVRREFTPGVYEGKPYQIVVSVLTVCERCGQQYVINTSYL
jgi:hypothetical protein